VAAPAGQASGEVPGEVPGDTAPVPAGDSGITEPLIPETRSSAGSVSDAAGPEIHVLPESNSDEIDALLTQVRGHQLKALQDSIKWATDIEPAGKNTGGDIPVWNTNRTGSTPEQSKIEPLNGRGIADLPALNTERMAETAPVNRISGFFTKELFRVSAGTDESIQNLTLEAFARMAEGRNALRQAALGADTGQVAAMSSGRGVVSTEEANGVSLTAARGEAVLASLMKMASARRVEPVMISEDVEDAFIFGAPQETALSGGKSAPVNDVWARAVVSRVHDETMDARAAGKTSVSFDITTESGEIVRVRIAMRNNLVSGRIGVMDSATREILALHIPELNQRLEMENLIPERFDVYVMDGGRQGERRGQERKGSRAAGRSDGQKDEDNFIYISSEPRAFEKWA
jgi:hypothetical protein